MKLIRFLIIGCLCIALDLLLQVFGFTFGSVHTLYASPLGAAAIIGGASFLSGLFGAGSQSAANETNLQATRETNAQNYKMFQEQLGFNREMYEKANAYNTPAAQRRRFEAAGINPYFALGNMDSGNASMQTSPSPNPAVAPHVNPVDYGQMFNGIPNAVGAYYDNKLKSEQADSVGISNKIQAIELRYKAVDKQVELQQKIADLENKKALTASEKQRLDNLRQEYRVGETNLKYLDDYLGSRNELQRNQSAHERALVEKTNKEAEYQSILNKFLPPQLRAQINALASQAASNYASAEQSRAGAEYTRGQNRREDELQSRKVLAASLANALCSKEISLKDLQLPKEIYNSRHYKQLLYDIEHNNIERSADNLSWMLGKMSHEWSPFIGLAH